MHWKLHIGTEKTGSSHLQSVAAKSRADLAKLGISFPPGSEYDEGCMNRGEISAGNARLLAEALVDANDRHIQQQLKLAALHAERCDAREVVLASEWLLAALTAPGQLSRLLYALDQVGAESVSFLLILRDPVDQCVSLYKHRAKGGTAGTMEDWILHGYQLPVELKRFRREVDKSGINLLVRRYQREPGRLDQLFFSDWLGVDVPQVSVPKSVNSSLTFAELELLRHVAHTCPSLAKPVFDCLSLVESNDKAGCLDIELHARGLAAKVIAEQADEWTVWNELLPEDEQLEIPEMPQTLPPRPSELNLSDRQMAALAHLLGKVATPGFIINDFWYSRMRPTLGRLARVLGLRR